jgi:carbon storage regulator
MLVLSRKVSERIWIGDEISVTIVRINGNAVRVGINAPPHLSVIRDELKVRQKKADASPEMALCEEPQAK